MSKSNLRAKSAATVQTATKLLKHARDIVASGWTRKAYARSAGNRIAVGYNEPEACHFCTAGAMFHAAHELGIKPHGPIYREAENRLKVTMGEDFIKVNDNRHTKQEHVVMAFDLAALGAGASPTK